MADSNEREKIFGQLFQTRIYRRLEESLKAKAAEIRRERERQLQLQQGILEGADLESVEALEKDLAELEPAEKAARDEKNRQEETFAVADKRFEQAKALHEEFARLEATTEKLKTHEQEKARMDKEQQRLERAERAGRMQPLFRERSRCETELNEVRKAVGLVTTRQQRAEQTLAEATKNQAGTNELQKKLDQAKQQSAQLDGYRVRADKLSEARQNFQVASLATEQAELLLNFKLLADQYLSLHEQEQLYKDRQRQEVLVKEKREQEATLRRSFEKFENGAKELELAWHQGQAAILAAELKAGEPCPVCGSREHPAPTTTDHRLPTQQEVQRARQQARDFFSDIEKAQIQTADELEKLRDLERFIETRQNAVDIATSLSELKMKIGVVQNRAADLRFTLPDRRQVAELSTEQLQNEHQSRKDHLTGNRTQLVAAEQELPENYRDPRALEQDIEQGLKQVEQLVRQIEELAVAHQKAQGEMTAANTALGSAKEQQQKSEGALKQAEESWLAVLENSPFADEGEFRSALLQEDQYDALKKRIADYDAAGQRLAGAVQQLQVQLQGKERPNLQELEERRRNAESEKNQATLTWQQLDKRLSLLLDTRKKLQKAAAEREELDKQYAVVGTLSDVANGQTGNKISLQRFVLSVLLDDVLIEASQRLSLMSKGRYQLLRKEDRAKGNKASGLELEVEDAYTGKQRPVATLSGGESFMAALSLALGLSDVVQAYAGGIRLDTLFIDEGFGSLDAESLDLAIRTLVDLQSSGRMVGIISHVAELKEQLPLRIDVVTGRAGSGIRVVTP
jgi:exonuclease SbcC